MRDGALSARPEPRSRRSTERSARLSRIPDDRKTDASARSADAVPELASGAGSVVSVPTVELAAMASPYNPRRISEHDLEALRRSMRAFGVVQPIVVNRRTGHIVGGHQRVIAAAAPDPIDSLPVVYVELDAAAEKTLNLALNRISGDWDDAALLAVLRELDVDARILSGFTDNELLLLTRSLDAAAPDSFGELDALTDAADHRCPSCGFEWNGEKAPPR